MHARFVWVIASMALPCGCAAILGIDDGKPRTNTGGDAMSDGAITDGPSDVSEAETAPPVTCFMTNHAFAAPTRLTSLDSNTTVESQPSLTNDELMIFFYSNRTGTVGGADIFTATRAKRTDAFGPATAMGSPPNASTGEFDPRFSPDLLTLWFSSDRVGGGLVRIYTTTRATPQAAFTAATALALGGTTTDDQPFFSADGKTIWFASNRLPSLGDYDIWIATGGPAFNAPTSIPELSSAQGEATPVVSPDGLDIYLGSNRTGALGLRDIYHSSRATTSSTWSTPVPVSELNTIDDEIPGWISPDGCRLYFSSDHGGSNVFDIDLWVAERTP